MIVPLASARRWTCLPAAARWLTCAAAIALCLTLAARAAAQSADALPQLTQPVNDFATVIDGASAAELDRMIRALQRSTGDVVVVATVPTYQPFGSIDDYAVKLFENHGRGIGSKEAGNGVLVLLAVNDRKARIEVGYGLEGAITDGYSGETIRQYMAPYFRDGRYGEGLKAAVARLIGRIAEERKTTVTDVEAPARPEPARRERRSGPPLFFYLVLAWIGYQVISGIIGSFTGGGRRRRRRWGSGWSGWTGGVGPFGGSSGGWGGGGWSGGGGGGGGGWGGFSGGSSGGGGASGSW